MPVKPPTPTGARENEVQRIVSFIHDRLTPKYGDAEATKLADDYAKYADAHPKLSAQQAYVAWFLITTKINKQLGKDLQAEVGAIGKLSGETLKSLPSWIPSFTGDLRHLMLRVAEVAIGGLIIVVAANAILKETTGVSPIKAASKVVK